MNIQFFKKKPNNNFKKKSLAPDANFFWKIIIFSVLMLIGASFLFGYYVFNNVKHEYGASTGGINKKQPVEQERIRKALEYFSAREKKSLDVLNTPSIIIDPSL